MRTHLLSTLFASAVALLASVAHASSIAVTDITGDVKVTQGGKTSSLAKGATLGSGSTLLTGPAGVASIAFSNGAILSVSADSVLAIEEYSQRGGSGVIDPSKLTKEPTASRTILNLRKGNITGEIKQLNLPAGSVFKVKTPAGPLTIKGTTINVSVSESANGTFTVVYSIVEGSGLVEGITVNAVDLGNGQSVTITISGDQVILGPVTGLSPAQIASANQVVATLKKFLAGTTFGTASTAVTTFTVQGEKTEVSGGAGSNPGGLNR